MLERAYDRFCEQHDRVYGHSTRSASRFVNLRVIQRAANRMPAVRPPPRVDAPARKGSRAILLAGAADFVAAEVWERDALAPGDTIQGPAIVEQADTTTLIEPGWTARVAEDAVLLLTEASVR
jgi:N-methylhydantoinase A/oxoprolinase/acetone carboxylase beta subunit